MTTTTARPPLDLLTPEYDPYSVAVVADPYPVYKFLRNSQPLYYNPRLEFYALTRYDDIVDYGRDWQTFSYAHGADIDDSGDAFGPGNFLELDPPAHTAMRDVVRRAFVPKALRARLEDLIERETTAILDTLLGRGSGDFGSELAWTLPMRVASELLGFNRDDLPMLERWERDFAHRTLGQRTVPQTAVQASHQLRAYFAELIRTPSRRSSRGLISMIANAYLPEPREEVAASMVFLLWAASVETTACLLTNGAVLLDIHRNQREWLAEHPDAIPGAVEEFLRFEAPLQVMRRTTTRAVEIHGEEIPTGSSIFTVYGAANRDERRFADPDRFDVSREPQRNLAFGDGIHHCLGAPLARLEAQIVFRQLLERSPRYSVDRARIKRIEHYIVRGFTHVPVSLPGVVG